MKQISRSFHRGYYCDPEVYCQLNEFLAKHPNYSVNKVSYSRPNPKLICEDLFVVFDVIEN